MRLTDIIIHEDNDLIILNKPSGLLSIPDREGKEVSLKKLLQEKFGEIFTVHRLDKGTSGLIVFARNASSHKHLSGEFEHREAIKIYYGLVLGSPAEKKGVVDASIAEHPVKKGLMVVHRQGKPALTDYEVIEGFGKYSWMKFQIHTGRTHQIRVHMQQLGHPIACDDLYGDGKPVLLSSIKPKFYLSKNEWEERPLLNRLALHAFSLEFTSPNSEKMFFEAPYPKDLKAVLQQLAKNKKRQ